jgi:hypothetical protein
VLHQPGVVACLQDLAVMCEPVEHGGGHFLIAEDQIGGDDHGGLLVEHRDKVEQQFAGVFREQRYPRSSNMTRLKRDRQALGQPPRPARVSCSRSLARSMRL